MANGKIIYTPAAFRSLALDGTEYMTLDDSDFNVGSGNFSIDALIYLQTTVDDYKYIAYKVSADWAPDAGYGYDLYVSFVDNNLCFDCNDDGSTMSVVTGASTISLDTWHWVRVTVDRAGYIRLYIDGVLSNSLDISARSGSSFDNAGVFYAGKYIKGNLGLLRFDKGRVLPTSWNSEEYSRLIYGYPRRPRDYSALWTFGDTLTDLSADAYVLTHSGTAAYAAGYPTVPISYTFGLNQLYGHKPQFLEADDLQRSLDGSLVAYSGPRKQSFDMDFLCYWEQAMVLQSIYASGYEFDFYEDADGPLTFTARMTGPPDVRSKTWNLFDVGLALVEI